VVFSRAWATHLEQVTDSIISNWKPDLFDPRILSLENPPVTGHEQYNLLYEY